LSDELESVRFFEVIDDCEFIRLRSSSYDGTRSFVSIQWGQGLLSDHNLMLACQWGQGLLSDHNLILAWVF